ncbi:MAG: MFS transporter [Pseudomonadota bacterium]
MIHYNVKYYPVYLFFRNIYFWGPAFFLYFTSVLTLSQTIWLEAIYYIGVSVLEVPSGYLSDRLGRKITLMMSSGSLSLAYLVFFLGDSFPIFAVAQIFMATGFAFSSGTDTAFHYESLYEINQQGEYGQREAKALQFSFFAGAIGALVGGGLAVYNLKWIYGASFLTAVISLLLILRMKEPQKIDTSIKHVSMALTVYELLKKTWDKKFRFFTLYIIVMTVLLHLPYEFYQPYLENAGQIMGMTSESTPGLTGIHLAVTMLIGSFFTRFGIGYHHRCRVRLVLIGCAVFQLLIIGMMALVVHPVIIVLLMARTVSKAISTPLINAEVTPMLKQSERSTFLSIQSLLGRLSYGMVLILIPFGASFFSNAFHGTLVTAFAIGILLFLIVFTSSFSREPSQHCCSDH